MSYTDDPQEWRTVRGRTANGITVDLQERDRGHDRRLLVEIGEGMSREAISAALLDAFERLRIP